jgi:hypothetical protein
MAQLEACTKNKMFALSTKPQNPELLKGELLLLQLVKTEAIKRGKTHSRIEFALIFDHMEQDHGGKISRQYWPSENRVWDWIVYCSEIIPTAPFSLEDVDLSKNYGGQNNARYIDPQDEKLILKYIPKHS